MKAKLTERKEVFNINHRKENKLWKGYKVLDSKNNELVDCRLYFAGTTAYSCLWVSCSEKRRYIQGSGKAGGYGYCKGSSAISHAIYNAGFDLSESINGVGFEAVQSALLSIAKSLTKRKLHFVAFYG